MNLKGYNLHKKDYILSGFLAVLDDIAMLMDDTAVMAKVAAKKTAGVLGDDLAVGADQASQFKASRELPVIWAITKGSFLNKLIILPFAFLMSYFASFLIVPVLLLGGAYLSYEGMEKIIHVITRKHEEEGNEKSEEYKIKSAIKTDFILSIEIIMIALGTVVSASLFNQIIVVSLIAILATVGVYGIVALMVRLDDGGYHLIKNSEGKHTMIAFPMNLLGKFMVASLPKLIKLLSIVGTVAMLLVGGGMYVHNIAYIHHYEIYMPMILLELLLGIIVGTIIYYSLGLYKKIKTFI